MASSPPELRGTQGRGRALGARDARAPRPCVCTNRSSDENERCRARSRPDPGTCHCPRRASRPRTLGGAGPGRGWLPPGREETHRMQIACDDSARPIRHAEADSRIASRWRGAAGPAGSSGPGGAAAGCPAPAAAPCIWARGAPRPVPDPAAARGARRSLPRRKVRRQVVPRRPPRSSRLTDESEYTTPTWLQPPGCSPVPHSVYICADVFCRFRYAAGRRPRGSAMGV